MKIRTPEHHATPERIHHGCLEYEEDGASKHYRHCSEEGGTEKHMSSDDKHKHRDDLEGRSSKHKHKHHKHKHRRKRQKDHNEGSADEIGSDRGDFGLGGHTDGDCRTGDALTADAEINDPRIEHSGEDFNRKNSFMVREENGEIVRAGGVVDTSEVAYTEEAQQSSEDLKTRLPDMAGINSLNALDDEKEEGEILDEEDITHIIAESDIESGEIKTGEVSGLQDAGVDGISSNVFLAKEVQSLQSTEFFNLKLSMRLVNHKALFVEDHVTSHTKGEHGKAICSGAPALQSMLGITEAYDSEHGLDDSRVDGRMTADLESHLDEVRGRVEVAQPRRYNKLIRAGFDVTADIMSKSEKMDTHDSASASEGDSFPPLGKLHCGGSQSQEKGVGQDNLKRELRKSRQSQSQSPDSRVGERQRLRSRSQEADTTMDGKQKAGTSISPSKVFLGWASERISHYPVLQGSGSLDDAVNKAQRRKRCRSLESTEELLARRPQSSLLEREIDEHRHKGNTFFHSTKTLPEQLHADSGLLRSRESSHEGMEHRTTHGCHHSRDGRPRDVESGATCHSRRSRSREHVVYQRRCDESREIADMTESKELAHDNKYNRDTYGRSECGRRSRSREAVDGFRLARDSPDKSLRGRRSKSRETGHDYRNRYERSERQRRSRSKQVVHDSKYSKDNAGRSEQARRSRSRESGRYSKYIKDSSERYEHGRRSMSREAAHDSWYGKDSQERTERGRRSRSREALHESRHAMEEGEQSQKSRSREAAYDPRDNRDSRARYEQRQSRSRDGGRLRAFEQDYVDRRRRSISRSGRDSLDRRRRSMSKESVRDHRDYVDRRRQSRSKELSRDGRMIDHHECHRNGWHARVEEHSRLTETSQEAVRDKTNDKSFKDVNMNLRDEEDQADCQESVTLQSEDEDVERIKEESRIRRRAILEKYKKQQQSNNELRNFTVIKDLDLNVGLANLGASDSTRDRRPLLDENASVVSNDLRKDAFSLGKWPLQNGFLDRPSGTRGLGEGTPKSEKSNDMFGDYIFGDSPAGGRKLAKGDGLALETSGLPDNWDDAEGYYCYRIGEILDGRYEVVASHGRGVFSSVVRARDLKATQKESEEVAIKIIRNNEVMFKSGQQEHAILKKLAGADPENRRHCVLFVSCFEYRNHLCLVFESLHMNLREILKKFRWNIGMTLKAVRAYAKQLFIALKHLRNCGVLHCDIKPDNMLVNEAKNVLKLCDFGSAMFSGENEITPYLVSRFYRAPEIILGLPYDHPLDMWSVGCCLYEFFTGKVLFPGPTNNDMLRLHMELKGLFPKKMLKKAGFASKHFDQDFNFCAVEEDPVTKTNIKRVMVNVKPKDIGSLVTGEGTADEDFKMLSNFKDLLDKIFMLDPEKRLTVSQALSHSFMTGK